jgi:hypothetical protein
LVVAAGRATGAAPLKDESKTGAPGTAILTARSSIGNSSPCCITINSLWSYETKPQVTLPGRRKPKCDVKAQNPIAMTMQFSSPLLLSL